MVETLLAASLPKAGDTARLVRTITHDDVEAFARLSGDRNPLHVDESFARQTSFQRPVAHGMLLANYVSTLVGMQLPGPGALWSSQSFRWKLPVFTGDTIEFTLQVKHVSAAASTVAIEVRAMNQKGELVMDGEGAVMMLERHVPAPETGERNPVAWVTGASGGIGAEIARALARTGMQVGVHYLDHEEDAAEVCRTIVADGGSAVIVRADILNRDHVRETAARLHQQFGHAVDVLVHCSSLPVSPKPFLDSSWEDAQRMIDIQVRGAWYAAQAVLPEMIERRHGVIVLMGSAMSGSTPPPQWSTFLLAKAAMHSLAHSLAVEFGPSGVRVNLVSPGMVNTATVASIPERLRKVHAMQSPLRKAVTPQEVAQVVAFLCSESASAVTGIEIPVCGGAVMT